MGAQTPQTLNGESFQAQPNIIANCNPDGTSTVSFTAAGTASGPYPGTFTESGTATIGFQTLHSDGGASSGELLTLDGTFSIASGSYQITGTKTLVLPLTDLSTQVSIGQCNTFGTAGNRAELVDVIARYAVGYQAIISISGSTYADQGTAPQVFVQRVRYVDEDPIRTPFLSFVETFSSSLAAPVPLTSAGQSTGGGQVAPNATFGFNAKSDAKGVKGSCTVIDRASDTTVKCLDVTSYLQNGNVAHFWGNARVNGADTTYHVEVRDLAEPGTGSDIFRIDTANGYSVGGVLTQGNVQIHK